MLNGAKQLDTFVDPTAERLWTSATVITFARTLIAVTLGVWAAHQHDLGLLIAALAVYWVGDMLDGYVARVRGCETRIGASLDILCDRFCCAVFYVGLMWLKPDLAPAIAIYLAEFMVIDCFLSIAFLAWKVRSPNYFYVIDRTIYRLNWSHPAKAVNSALFAVLMLLTQTPWIAGVIAGGLLVFKIAMLVRLAKIGLPIPENTGS